jgi:hypothetical protein
MAGVMKEIAKHPDHFTLYERPGGSNGWINLKLIAECDLPKHNWWLAWNGSRLAQNRDAKLLRNHQPEIFDWLIGILSSGAFLGEAL